ncbi:MULTISPECIES: M12 family metallopeptidase [Nocardia]|uniref:M12 family metallopeptidase n=1 Tax=Nocardia TaxID=1817 RepID=UPI000BEF59D3|nr:MULTISPECIES: M12 family metallopeptidase [Nocardia]MBF6184887.1 peptidase M12 [Nocardia farcinica]MBF6248756.1 peptidase M12 [Nocardia elegans]MBF6310731.1 peptidase M12 [Nocardia farcinica]MBF6405449.1 peptidase M12 [Nocardia farcinica]PEH75134.1 peptidase M12 [Nocardia sp. FDAARGOS_372]
MNTLAICSPKRLPDDKQIESARLAVEINPANMPYVRPIAGLVGERPVNREFISAMTTKYWRSGGVHLGVRFLDTTDRALQDRILAHMNAWSPGANIGFHRSTAPDAEIRIARTPGDGYWSYLGTDVLQIPADEPTMNLDSFGLDTDEREYTRVVRHETGHTLGFPHEHLRRDVVHRIDPAKAIRYFRDRVGWSEATTRAQVLTPLEEVALITTPTDTQSIMCYQLPGSIMRDGQPVPGGLDINDRDRGFVHVLYPTAVATTPIQALAGVH